MTDLHRDLSGVTIAFDLDGTLVDSAPDLIGTLNRLLGQEGLPPVPVSAARHLVGQGARALLKKGFTEAGALWDEVRSDELFDRFIADYGAHIADHSRVFDGVVETLDGLAAQGAILCVATNKPTGLAVALIEALGLTRHFAAVAGPDAVSAKKPAAAHIVETVRMAGGDPARTIMVGDSIIDVGAAQAAGIPCVVVSFGYTEIAPADMGADVVIDRFADLPDAVERLLASRSGAGYVPAS